MATIKISAIGSALCRRGSYGRQIGAVGFTLIELMVVLLIMVLVAASIPLAMNRMAPGYRLRSAADQMAIDIRNMHVSARTSGAVLSMACAGGSYSIESTNGNRERMVTLPNNVSLLCKSPAMLDSIEKLRFYADGSATPAEIVLTDGKRAVELTISQLTGAVRITS